MSKKTIYIIISILLTFFVVAIIGYYLYLKNNTNQDSGPTTNIFKGFFPFGGDENNNTPPENNFPEDDNTTPEQPVSFDTKLRKITSEQVAGAGVVTVKAGNIVRYIERATGHIYEVELFSPRSGRISNTTIPKVYEALFGNTNNSLVTRYLSDDDYTVDTYSINIKNISTTTENTISGIAMQSNISDISVNGNSVFYIVKGDNGSQGYITNFGLSSKKQVWNSPLNELLSQYVNQKTIAITTKPNEKVPGYIYFLDTNTGSYKKVIGDVFGLSTLVNQDATKVLYYGINNQPEMYSFEVKNGQKTKLSPVTFPEKCAWSKKDVNIVYCAVPEETLYSNSLDSWYKGSVTYTDSIWRYDIKNDVNSIILEAKNESGESLDIIKPILSEDEKHFVFINKKDNSLWSLDLTK